MPALFTLPTLLALLSSATPALTPKEMSPFLRVISASVGTAGRIACRDIDVAMQLKKDGISPDAKAPVAFATSDGQIRDYLAEGKLVVCASEAGIKDGAGIAIFREAGRPVMVVSLKNASAAGFTLSDALLKIARVK
jgi:hypothetical protein